MHICEIDCAAVGSIFSRRISLSASRDFPELHSTWRTADSAFGGGSLNRTVAQILIATVLEPCVSLEGSVWSYLGELVESVDAMGGHRAADWWPMPATMCSRAAGQVWARCQAMSGGPLRSRRP